MTDIWQRRLALIKARRAKMSESMKEYDETIYHPAMSALREECGASEEGHDWRFSNLGPAGDPWFTCSKCWKSECRREEND